MRTDQCADLTRARRPRASSTRSRGEGSDLYRAARRARAWRMAAYRGHASSLTRELSPADSTSAQVLLWPDMARHLRLPHSESKHLSLRSLVRAPLAAVTPTATFAQALGIRSVSRAPALNGCTWATVAPRTASDVRSLTVVSGEAAIDDDRLDEKSVSVQRRSFQTANRSASTP